MPAPKPWFDPETGYLLLDEHIAEMPSFRKIMEDGIVTEEELASQAERVTALLKKLEAVLSPEPKSIASQLLGELAVLHAIQNNLAHTC